MCGLDDDMGTAVATYRPGCLLVDDREENLFAHEALLEDTGAWICKARSGDEALELLLRHDFAVALIDVQMPGMDGLELAELMRGIERTRRVPIIFVTAAQHDESTVLRGYANGGAVDFLYKPLSPAVVKRKVGVFLEMARHESALKTNLERIERSLAEAEASRRAMEKAHELRDHLLAIAGHDLRTPLTAIVGTARLIEEDAEYPVIAPRIARIVRSAERMAEIIEEMVELSRAHQAGGFPIQRGDVELSALCRGVVAEIQVVHPDHAIALAAPGELSGRWDARALTQALSNLVINAGGARGGSAGHRDARCERRGRRGRGSQRRPDDSRAPDPAAVRTLPAWPVAAGFEGPWPGAVHRPGDRAGARWRDRRTVHRRRRHLLYRAAATGVIFEPRPRRARDAQSIARPALVGWRECPKVHGVPRAGRRRLPVPVVPRADAR
jgi:CheY-like chemotaxis protein